MADLQLNKPLYKSEDDEANFKQPIPRPPRANVIGRAAAVFLDVMLLHLVFGLIAKYLPDVPLALGAYAPWVGLLLGFVYFTVGFSDVTLGRTFGKLITRVQVADMAGPDLPIGRAAKRAALLLWPIPVHLVLMGIAEYHSYANPTSVYTTLEIFGVLLIVGWMLGNFGFAMFDPHHRTVYDRLVNSVVINAELQPEPVAEYLADVRRANQQAPLRGSIMALGLALTGCMAIAAASAMSMMTHLRDMSPEQRQRTKDMVLAGYGVARPARPLSDTETTGTIPVTFHYRTRDRIDVEKLKTDPSTTATLDRLIAAATGPEFTKNIHEYISSANMERGKRGELPMETPTHIRFEMSFVEWADLFWAKHAHPVYTVSKVIDIPTTVTQAGSATE